MGKATVQGLTFREHADEAHRYRLLKAELAVRYRDDREAYTSAKATYVDEVMAKAKAQV